MATSAAPNGDTSPGPAEVSLPSPGVLNTVSGVVYGNVAQVGVLNGNLYVGTPPRTRDPATAQPRPAAQNWSRAASEALERARIVAPSELVGGQAELDVLERFCTSERGSEPFLWWTGPAWAGKSALLAWFVTHLPVGVRVVSFFGTPEWTGRNVVVAFVNAVCDQLAEVVGGPAPTVAPPSARRERFVDLLSEAAGRCGERGDRLVLVVDGLAQDDLTEALACLPSPPPHNLRVVASRRSRYGLGRSHNEFFIRGTDEAESAAQRDLTVLSAGSVLGRRLLGLLAVCRGGVTVDDLAELGGSSPQEVADCLRGADRWLARRDSRLRAGGAGSVVVFRDGKLHEMACGLFEPSELALYRGLVHAWADRYERQGWPPGTPEYLLGGYFQVVLDERDGTRAVALATSVDRQSRLSAWAGGGRAAVDEVCAALALLRDDDEPDVVGMVRLAIHRDRLAAPVTIPVRLPAVWARLGEVGRAEALARSIPDAGDRGRALSALARALAEVGEVGRAEEVVRSMSDVDARSVALAGVAEAVAASDAGWAQSLARSIVVPHLREKALGSVAVAAAATNPERAESIARSLPDGHAKTRVTELIGHTILQRQAEALAAAGDFLLATATLSAVTSPYRRVRMACAIARRAVAAGEAGMAATLLTRASEEVERVGNTDERALSIQDFAHTAAVAGRLDWAKHLVDTIPGVSRRVQALAALARTAVDRGLAADATALFDAAEALAWSIGDPDDQAWALLAVAEHAENCGDRRRVDGIVHRARKALGGNRPAARLARALTTVAHAAAVNGHEDWARRLDDHIRLELADAADHELPAAPETVPRDVVSSVDDLHRSITEPARRAAEWAAMATTALDANQHRIYTAAIEQAIDLSCTLDDPMEEALVLADIVCAAAAADDDRVAGLLDRAEFAAGTVGGVDHRADALAKVAEAAADAGFFDRSEVLARSVTDIRTRARALTHVARCAAQRGDVGWAATTASSIPEAGHRAWALSTVVQATADLGEHEWAEELAGAIEPPATRAATLTAILPRLPDHRRRHVIAEVLDLDEWHQPLPALFAAHPEAIPAVVRELSLSYYGRPELDPAAAQIIA